MARGREGMAKQTRERVRQERQEAKRIRRETLAAAESLDTAAEARLLNEFRLLSERHTAGEISEATYTTERNRIFAELGIEQD
ncbi:MAG: hypothetical protein ACT4OP_05395 [Actinomycetota bacterium]